MSNRYAVEGVLRDLERGKRVLVVGVNLREAEHFLESVETAGGAPSWAKIVRANGKNELVHRSGGSLRGTSVRTRGQRGWAANVVLVLSFRALPADAQADVIALARPFQAAGAELILPE